MCPRRTTGHVWGLHTWKWHRSGQWVCRLVRFARYTIVLCTQCATSNKHTHKHTHVSSLSALPCRLSIYLSLFCLSLHRNTLLNCCMLYGIETHTPHDPHLMKLPVKTKHYCYPDNSCVLQNAPQSQMFRTKAVTLFTHSPWRVLLLLLLCRPLLNVRGTEFVLICGYSSTYLFCMHLSLFFCIDVSPVYIT